MPSSVTRLEREILIKSGLVETKIIQESKFIVGISRDAGLYKHLQQGQKITRFLYTFAIGSKKGLHLCLSNTSIRLGRTFAFYPETFLLPPQREDFAERATPESVWILKPSGGSKGKGIEIFKGNRVLEGDVIVQRYIQNPLTYKGFKFDVRFYVAVPSVDPVIIYRHTDGLVRLASANYFENFENFEVLNAHLTNYSVNKEEDGFVPTLTRENDGTGSKWSHEALARYLESVNFDINDIRKKADYAIAVCFLSAVERLKRQTNHRCSSELFAIDTIIDSDGNLFVNEVNTAPSLGIATDIDVKIKEPIVRDFFNLCLVGAPSDLDPITELHFLDQVRGGFERVFPLPKSWEECGDVLENPSPNDFLLREYLIPKKADR